ncbi:MAG: response regulator transcription factor [Anaerolineales bacterium]|nr:MAG: response regulator transcription factor [Anaerolineales bacterium]
MTTPTQSEGSGPTVIPGASILVVDDDQAIRRTLTEMFRRMGYKATDAASGEAALDQIGREPFDLVILDLNMPHMTGAEVLEQARKLAPDTVFVILTGYGSLDSAIVAIRHGAFDYLLKPSSMNEIARAVEAGLTERQRRTHRDEPVALLERALVSLRDTTQRADTFAPVERFLQVTNVTVDTLRRIVVLRGQPVELTPTEFDILVYLIRHRDRAISCRELASSLRGYELDERDARLLLRTHIHRLRHKLQPSPDDPPVIITIRGRGYAVDAAATDAESSNPS